MNHSHSEHNHSENEESQELMFKASLIERHLQDLAEKIDYVSQQLAELEEFDKNLKFLKNVKGKDVFSSVGKGVYSRSSCTDDSLFVNVGAGVIVKKTPEETSEIIKSQIKNFHEAKNTLMTQLEVYNGIMRQTINALSKMKEQQSQ